MAWIKWIKNNKLAITVITILLILDLFLAFKTLQDAGIDLRVSSVKTQHITDGYRYQVKLASTLASQDTSTLHMYYEDGTEKTSAWDLKKYGYKLTVDSPSRLEYVAVDSPQKITERFMLNNQKALPLWSDTFKLFTAYSVPEYDYLVDGDGNFWFVVAGRQAEDTELAVFLSVVNSTGQTLVDNLQISATNLQCRYPVMRLINGKVHVLWSGSLSAELTASSVKNLYHATFTLTDGKVAEISRNTLSTQGTSFIRAIFPSNDVTSPTFLAQTIVGTQNAYSLYELTDQSVRLLGNLTQNGKTALYGNNEIRSIAFLQQAKDYQLVWSERDDRGNIYFTKSDSTGAITVPATNIISHSPKPNLVGLNAVSVQDKIYLFWSYTSRSMATVFHIYYMVVDNNGQILQDITDFLKPSFTLLHEISVAQDEHGNLNMVWMDGSLGTGNGNVAELAFKQVTSDLQTSVPMYRLTDRARMESSPKLKIFNANRYVTWHEFNHGRYNLFVKSNDPVFTTAIAKAHRWSIFWEKATDFVVNLLESLGLQIIYFFPTNTFEIIGLVFLVALFSLNKLQNTRRTWLGAILFMIFLKFLSYKTFVGEFTQLDHLTVFNWFQISGAAIILTAIVYALFNVFLPRKDLKASIEKRFCYIVGWLAFNSFLLVFVERLM